MRRRARGGARAEQRSYHDHHPKYIESQSVICEGSEAEWAGAKDQPATTNQNGVPPRGMWAQTEQGLPPGVTRLGLFLN